MLYDTRWDKQTKADPLTLDSLIAWLEKQPAATSYPFFDCKGGCLIDLYMASLGIGPLDHGYGKTCEAIFGDRYCVRVLTEHPWTFGAALERARAELNNWRPAHSTAEHHGLTENK